MTNVTITYVDGQVVKDQVKNIEIAQVYVDGIIKSHIEVGILHEIKNITTHEGKTTHLSYPSEVK